MTNSKYKINEIYWYHVDEVMKQNCCVFQQEQADKTNISHTQMWAMIADPGHQKGVCTMVTINFHFEI
jgi:hypothetical protein